VRDVGATMPLAAGPIHRRDAALKLWGDPVAGEVNDWIYMIGERICSLVFSMPPGMVFTQSDAWKPIYAADEVYYVLKGTLALANPATGEVVRAEAGEALQFHPDTWHHGFNQGAGELQILEFFAPAKSQLTVATAGDGYGDKIVPPKRASYHQDAALEDGSRARDRGIATIQKVDPRRTLWRLEGEKERILVGLWVSTPALTAGSIELLPGQSSGVRTHGGELALFVERGMLNVLMPEADTANRWSELHAEDAFYAPGGTPYRFFNMTAEPVRVLFGVGSGYLPNPGR
jgi:mannose-6-phosphate isomerase-like protein (cupin superfamily)